MIDPDIYRPADPPGDQRMSFDLWLDCVEETMRDWQRAWGDLPYILPLVSSMPLDTWRAMYEDGMHPLEAFHADQDLWDCGGYGYERNADAERG